MPARLLDSNCSTLLVTLPQQATEQRRALPSCGEVLVQRYVAAPLLFRRRKFTLRLNVAVLRLAPERLVFLSKACDVHVCGSEYAASESSS